MTRPGFLLWPLFLTSFSVATTSTGPGGQTGQRGDLLPLRLLHRGHLGAVDGEHGLLDPVRWSPLPARLSQVAARLAAGAAARRPRGRGSCLARAVEVSQVAIPGVWTSTTVCTEPAESVGCGSPGEGGSRTMNPSRWSFEVPAGRSVWLRIVLGPVAAVMSANPKVGSGDAGSSADRPGSGDRHRHEPGSRQVEGQVEEGLALRPGAAGVGRALARQHVRRHVDGDVKAAEHSGDLGGGVGRGGGGGQVHRVVSVGRRRGRPDDCCSLPTRAAVRRRRRRPDRRAGRPARCGCRGWGRSRSRRT